ncbi:pimeloyl-ACP methyl ester carboxylesterase [Kitasatospora sp. MAP12-15]|uniref:alpha/beta fold hydrolase n=1 Tax=unclassified Kitasatospora TaxID=2633591 RepID=UPI00247685EC|nr:alpha/beta hydrolase [Kitasatospora sp. MAP12-44]MDH6115560.1 pimeloyl-ACP methyl ester carboxylesterase [Kitasatospora sp. MAP12-44]
MENSYSYLDAKTSTVEGSNGISYAYRRLGPQRGRPLVLLQHFRGNLDNWDPDLVDALAASRDVITFDNAGVAATTGTTPNAIAQMADDAITFTEALGLDSINLLGFSIGSFVAQEITLTRSSLVSRVVLASTAPQGAPGMHGWAPDIISAVGAPTTQPEGYLHAFFTDSLGSRAAGQQVLGRIFARTEGRDEQSNWRTRNAQYDAVLKWGTPNFGLLQRLAAIKQPVFIANGDDDRMILPWYSHLTASLIPDARVKLYPDAAHGFLFQHAQNFATDVHTFLDA